MRPVCHVAALMLLFLALLLSACAQSDAPPTATPATIACPGNRTLVWSPSAPPPTVATATALIAIQELDAAERTWSAAGITHYRISVKVDSYATPHPPFVVEVQDGVILTGMPQFTVPGLFTTVRLALADPCQAVSVGYSSPYGYPSFISGNARGGLSDASSSESVVDFVPLP